MAYDAELAVQVAIYRALSEPARGDGVAVYEHVPDEADPPFVVIDKVTLTDAGGKDGGLDQAEVDVVSFHVGAGREFLTPILAENRRRIDRQAMIDPDGQAQLSPPAFVSSDTGVLEDAITYFGTQKFILFVQPAD